MRAPYCRLGYRSMRAAYAIRSSPVSELSLLSRPSVEDVRWHSFSPSHNVRGALTLSPIVRVWSSPAACAAPSIGLRWCYQAASVCTALSSTCVAPFCTLPRPSLRRSSSSIAHSVPTQKNREHTREELTIERGTCDVDESSARNMRAEVIPGAVVWIGEVGETCILKCEWYKQ